MKDMEIPFPLKQHRRPSTTGGRPTIRKEVDIDTITREMAVPTEAIAKGVRELPPILPAAGLELDLPSVEEADLRAGYL